MRPEIIALFCYFSLILAIGFSFRPKKTTASEFLIGDRSLGYWLTALAAHASDMSSWLFLAYPALIFTQGLVGSWVAIGLALCMLLNWEFIAPRVRKATEETNSLTFSSFFERRLGDASGRLRVVTALVCFFFTTIYISAGLVGIGLVAENLFGIAYQMGILFGLVIVVGYVFVGGYLTLARIDLVQGLFLLGVILLVPLLQLGKAGGLSGILASAPSSHFALVPNTSGKTLLQIFSMVFGWGLGYFGQPGIITKFMGIKQVAEIRRSQTIGMSWMVLTLSGATLIGLVALPLFQGALVNPELLFIQMVKDSFSPFLVGFILCAVLAASLNVMSSQLLVLSSIVTEDFYKKKNLEVSIWVPRTATLCVALVAFIVAYFKISSIYSLVQYAWSGLGASFGPLLIFTLYWKKTNRSGAWAGLFVGSLSVALWPVVKGFLPIDLDGMVPGFFLSCLVIWSVSLLTREEKLTRLLD